MSFSNTLKVALAATVLSISAPVFAQGLSVASVVAACGAGSPCAPLVTSYLASVPAAQRAAVIAELAASLAEVNGAGANIAEGLRAAAAASPDAAQAEQISALADSISGGDGGIDTPVAAGPAAGDDALDGPDSGSQN